MAYTSVISWKEMLFSKQFIRFINPVYYSKSSGIEVYTVEILFLKSWGIDLYTSLKYIIVEKICKY